MGRVEPGDGAHPPATSDATRDGNGHVRHRHGIERPGELELDAAIGLRRILEALPVIAWVADDAGRFVAANGRWTEYTATAPSTRLARNVDLSVHPDDQQGLVAAWRQSLRTRASLETSIRLLRHDRVFRWHLIRAVPFESDDGRQLWIGTSTDIDDERAEGVRRTLVAEAATRLDASLEVEETVAALVELVVPTLADSCRVELTPATTPVSRRGGDDDDHGDGVLGHAAPSPASGHQGRAARRGPSAARTIVLTLAAQGQALGWVHLGRDGARPAFTNAERSTATEVARHAALALLNARLYEQERDARQRAEVAGNRTRRLFRLTRALSRAASPDEVAQLALRHGRAALAAPRGYLFVRSADGLAIERLAMAGYPAEEAQDWAHLPLGLDRPITHAARTGEEQWVEDMGEFRRHFPPRGDASSPGTRATVALPLVAEGRTLGVLGFSWTAHRDIPEDERGLARAISGLVAQALHRLALLRAREDLLADLETQHARLMTVVRQLPGGVVLADATGRVLLANAQAGRILGSTPVRGVPIASLPLGSRREDGTAYEPGAWPLERALAMGEAVENELMEVTHPDGTRRALLASAAPIRDRAGEIEAAVVTFSDITERRNADANEQYLAEATVLLASSLDPDDALAQLASLAVPRVADWCSIEVVDDEGGFRQVAVAHPDPAKAELGRALRHRFPIDPDGAVGTPAVVRSGVPQLVTEIPAELVDSIRMSDDMRSVVDGLQLRSYMCVPLRARGTIFGAITFVGAESGRRFGEADLTFAERLADRAATAMDNARLYREADRFRRMVEAEADVVLLFDPETLRVSYANRGAVVALGRTAHEIMASSVFELFEDLDAARLRSYIDPILAGRSDRRTILLALRGAGGPTPVELLVQGVNLPGTPPSVLAIARDVSERIESQARLRRLAEAEHARAAELNAVIRAMGDGVLACAADGTVTLSNPAADRLVGGVPIERYADLLLMFDDASSAPAIGSRGGPAELRLRGQDERWLELTTYPIGRLPGGGERETIVMLRDITEVRLSQAVRDTFVGVLSHELRTPVTTIFGGAKILARENRLAEEERRAIFTDIHLEAERLHRLVEDVIALTRFGEDGGDVGSEPVLLQRILPTIVRSEETRWPGATFHVSLPPGIPTVIADPTYVEQVLRNLLSNAAKYGGDGVVVQILVTEGPDEVSVRILDDGPGIAPDEADRVFDLYFRSPRTAARVSGAGIGLFVCARLVRAMGGRVWAAARDGGGAEFGFVLRRMDEESA
jgi:PAS domain S-box-containing protein